MWIFARLYSESFMSGRKDDHESSGACFHTTVPDMTQFPQNQLGSLNMSNHYANTSTQIPLNVIICIKSLRVVRLQLHEPSADAPATASTAAGRRRKNLEDAFEAKSWATLSSPMQEPCCCCCCCCCSQRDCIMYI